MSHPERLRRVGTDDRGSTSLQLVIVMPALLLAFCGALQAGLVFQARAVALAAAEEGARVASTETGSAGAGRSAGAAFAARAGTWLQGQSVSGSRSATRATITVTGTALSVVPGFDRFVVNQTASLPVERITG
jgi:Flp pilus assembly protein TadG